MDYQNLKEIKEAIEAGQRALEALEVVERSLNSARNWGVVDMLGGGLISGFFKHSNMDKAQDQMMNAQIAIERFKNELGDISGNPELKLSFSGTTKAFDYLVDDFFVDAMIQHEIHERRAQVEKFKSQIRGTLSKLEDFVK